MEEPSSGLADLLAASATNRRQGFPCIVECVREHDPALADELLAAIMRPGVSRSHKTTFLADMGLPISDGVLAHHIAGHCQTCRSRTT